MESAWSRVPILVCFPKCRWERNPRPLALRSNKAPIHAETLFFTLLGHTEPLTHTHTHSTLPSQYINQSVQFVEFRTTSETSKISKQKQINLIKKYTRRGKDDQTQKAEVKNVRDSRRLLAGNLLRPHQPQHLLCTRLVLLCSAIFWDA